MSRKELSSAPSMLPLYLRAALPLVPGLSRVPGAPVPHGKDVPDTELVLRDVATRAEDVAAYAKVCGFDAGGTLPATYPHVLAFPLHMQLMTGPDFPVPAIGLVHIENRIIQHRPLQIGEPLELTVRATPLEPHPKGRQFTILTTARDRAGDVVWEDESTNLRRGKGGGGKGGGAAPTGALPERETWELPGDLGRRYAAVSGDRNPIHLYSQTARLFGFPRAIAHGMWTKARCLAALAGDLPDAFAIDVQFRRPILLPGKVAFCAEDSSLGSAFAVRSADGDTPHLDGVLAPA